MKDICYAICPVSKKPVLVLVEPIQGLHLNLFKNTYWEEEYRFWYQRVIKQKDEIDFKIIDRVEESKIEEKIKFHSERLSQDGHQIINSESNPFRKKIYTELIDAVKAFDDSLFPLLGVKEYKEDSFLYTEEVECTRHILALHEEVLLRSHPKIEPSTELRFRIKLVYYTVILRRFFGFSEEELNDILFKRNLNILEFQNNMRIRGSYYLEDNFYDEMNLDQLNENYSYVQLVIRSERFIISYLRSQLNNETHSFKSISSVKFFLINSFNELSIERDMFDLIHYILERFNLKAYSHFRKLCLNEIIIEREDQFSDYRYLSHIWSILDKRFSNYESSKPNIGRPRKERYDTIKEFEFDSEKIRNDYNIFLKKHQSRPKITGLRYRNK